MGINADAQIVASVFMRNGGEGEKTKLFENLAPSEQRGLTKMADLRLSEEIVITFFDSESDWCLITTQRLIWATAGERQEMELLDLDNFDDDFEEAFQRALSRPDPDALNPKLDMREIRPVTLDGRRAKIEIEPGQTYWGFYNALRWLCHWFRVRGRPAAQAAYEAGANSDETN